MDPTTGPEPPTALRGTVRRSGDVIDRIAGKAGWNLAYGRCGEIDATPMRKGDDVGAAAAEAIRHPLEGREAEPPHVFLGRLLVAHDRMSAERIDAPEQEAFRFSGVGARERRDRAGSGRTPGPGEARRPDAFSDETRRVERTG